MNDWHESTRADYASKGLGSRSGYGIKPALLIVDFSNGFTDPASPLGGDFDQQVAVTARLLRGFRDGQLPVVFTTVAYEPDFRDAGVFIKKVPSLSILVQGSHLVEIDDRITPLKGEPVIIKKYASAFFGTDLDTYFKGLEVDTVVITGCTTSGCVRASAVDSLQHGFHTVVVREGVGDRAEGPHEANLFDMDAKYCDVELEHNVLSYLSSLVEEGGVASKVDNQFRQWWQQPPPTSVGS